jgi:hypothetical protein
MATKTKKTQVTIIDTTAKKTLELAKKANDLALTTTEKVAMKSISLTEKGIELSTKIAKKGLKASAKNQDFIFDTLETIKGRAAKFLPKFK